MNDMAIVIISACGWLAGQVLILLKHYTAGPAVSFFSLLVGFIFFFRAWRAVSLRPGSGIFGLNGAFVMGALALLIGVAGMAVVRNSPRDGLMFFILAGAMLFAARPAGDRFFDFFELPLESKPMQKWEPWFVLALLLVSGGIRLYDLANIPPVGIGGEGLVYNASHMLAGKGASYTPHIGGGTDWPTLTYYMGIFFANILGWDIGGIRFSSGVLGTIAVIAFYFLARRLTSPVSAVVGSLMYTVFMPQISMSRLYLGPLSLLFVPHIIGMGLLLAAASKPRWYLYLAAGAAVGYSLHGYVPGRGVLFIFLAWFALMAVTRKKIFNGPQNFFIFLLGFLLLASPVVYYALKYPANYWSYVNSVNPNKSAGAMSYVNRILASVPLYSNMLYTKSAWDIVMHMPYKPLFDPVTGALFGMGVFMCAFSFWKPVPAFLLAFLVAGMVPGMLGGGSSIQPNAQRTLLTYPIIFLICAYAFERIKRAYYSQGGMPAKVFIVAAGLIASLWVFQNGFMDYFIRFAPSPAVKNNAGYHMYLMGREIKKHMDAELHASPFFVGNDSFTLYVPPGKRLEVPPYPDGMLTLDRKRDHLLIIGPFYTNAIDIFREAFPNAEVKTYEEDEKNRQDPYYKDFPIFTGGRRHIDQFEPFVYMSSVFVTKSDAEDFQTSLVMESAGGPGRVRVFDGSGFAGKFSGKKVILKGAVIVPQESYYENSGIPVTFDMQWKGWSLSVDGRPQQFGRPFKADGGVHYFTLSGTVPAGMTGDLPLAVSRGGKNLAAEGRVVAMGKSVGVRQFIARGEKNWDKPYESSYRSIVPNLRMYDGMFMHLPFSLTEKALLSVPHDGEYEVFGSTRMRMRVKVDGIAVYDNLSDPVRPVTRKIQLSSKKQYAMETIMTVDFAPITDRALALYIKGPEMKEQIMIPAAWLSPAD